LLVRPLNVVVAQVTAVYQMLLDLAPLRRSTCSRIDSLNPAESLPSFVTSTPTIARLLASFANCTLNAGLYPPFAIFITRASGSLVLTRSCLA
jgi:hypothetical protein